MKKGVCIALLFSVLTTAMVADPLRTIIGDDTILPPQLHLVVQEDAIFTGGYIDEWEMRTRLRLGFASLFELLFTYSISYFPELFSKDFLFGTYYEKLALENEVFDLQNPRFAYIEPAFKIKITSLAPNIHLLTYGKFKHSFGPPLLVDYPPEGKDDNAIAVSTPNASTGNEVTAGLIMSLLLSDISEYAVPSLIAAADIKLLFGKDWLNPIREPDFMITAYLTPQLLFLKYWKVQLESRFEWLIGRGWHVEIIPGFRWEIYPETVIEMGFGLPIVGGDVSRMFFGFSFGLGRTKIVLSVYDIHFPPDSPDLWGFSDSEKVESNKAALEKLASQIRRYPDFDILIEGHTSSVHWADPEEFEREQREEMLPLSEARAAAVRAALIELGIDPSRMSSVGKGGSEPIVDFSVTEQQWKNRRVVIVLTKRRVVDR